MDSILSHWEGGLKYILLLYLIFVLDSAFVEAQTALSSHLMPQAAKTTVTSHKPFLALD